MSAMVVIPVFSSLAVVLVQWLRCADGRSNAAPHYRNAFAQLPQLTGEEKKILENVRTVSLDNVSRQLIGRAAPALQEVLLGATREQFDWPAESPKEVEQFYQLFPTLLELSQLACLRIRNAFQEGAIDAALTDLAALVIMARQFGREGPWMMKVIEFWAESAAFDIVAATLLRQKTRTLLRIEAALEALPAAGTLAQAMRREKQYLLQVSPREFENKSKEETLTILRQMESEAEAQATWEAMTLGEEARTRLLEATAAQYDTLGAILILPVKECRRSLAAFIEQHATTNPLLPSMLRQAAGMYFADARVRVRFAMLRAAIAVARGGLRRLGTVRDPLNGRHFVYRPVPDGFVLESTQAFPDRPVIALSVGGPARTFERFSRWLRRYLGW